MALVARDDLSSKSCKHAIASLTPRPASIKTSVSTRVKSATVLYPFTLTCLANPRAAILHVITVSPHSYKTVFSKIRSFRLFNWIKPSITLIKKSDEVRDLTLSFGR